MVIQKADSVGVIPNLAAATANKEFQPTDKNVDVLNAVLKRPAATDFEMQHSGALVSEKTIAFTTKETAGLDQLSFTSEQQAWLKDQLQSLDQKVREKFHPHQGAPADFRKLQQPTPLNGSITDVRMADGSRVAIVKVENPLWGRQEPLTLAYDINALRPIPLPLAVSRPVNGPFTKVPTDRRPLQATDIAGLEGAVGQQVRRAIFKSGGSAVVSKSDQPPSYLIFGDKGLTVVAPQQEEGSLGANVYFGEVPKQKDPDIVWKSQSLETPTRESVRAFVRFASDHFGNQEGYLNGQTAQNVVDRLNRQERPFNGSAPGEKHDAELLHLFRQAFGREAIPTNVDQLMRALGPYKKPDADEIKGDIAHEKRYHPGRYALAFPLAAFRDELEIKGKIQGLEWAPYLASEGLRAALSTEPVDIAMTSLAVALPFAAGPAKVAAATSRTVRVGELGISDAARILKGKGVEMTPRSDGILLTSKLGASARSDELLAGAGVIRDQAIARFRMEYPEAYARLDRITVGNPTEQLLRIRPNPEGNGVMVLGSNEFPQVEQYFWDLVNSLTR